MKVVKDSDGVHLKGMDKNEAKALMKIIQGAGLEEKRIFFHVLCDLKSLEDF